MHKILICGATLALAATPTAALAAKPDPEKGSPYACVPKTVGLKASGTLVSGAYVEMDPGTGSPQRDFVGLETPPVVRANVAGSEYVLTAERLPVLDTVELHAQLERTGVDVAGLVVNKRSPADGGPLLLARREQEEEHLLVLDRHLPNVPVMELPLLGGDIVGAEALSDFAELLGAIAG